MNGWVAHLHHVGDRTQVFIGRRRERSTDFLHPDGQTIVNIDESVMPSDDLAWSLPRGVVEAIAEAVKPGPSQGEVRRLEEALAVERGRIDHILGLPR